MGGGAALVRPGKPAADKARELVGFYHANGLILLSRRTSGHVIRVLTPLVITDEELEKDLEKISG